MQNELTNCPCHSGLSYGDCCGPFHANRQPAPTALALMRSRYSAYALGLSDYIIRTTHRDNPQYVKDTRAWSRMLANYCQQTRFLALEIIDFAESGDTATVSFRASLSQDGAPLVLAEKSYFVKIGNRWLYHSGEVQA